jgi:hypothetical protein
MHASVGKKTSMNTKIRKLRRMWENIIKMFFQMPHPFGSYNINQFFQSNTTFLFNNDNNMINISQIDLEETGREDAYCIHQRLHRLHW